MTTQQFSATVRHLSNLAIIDLHGEINGFAEDALDAAYSNAEDGAPATIVLNFEDVDYVNSTGIALIVSMLARAQKAKRQMGVYGLSDHYTEIFRITRLSDFMTMYPDEESALNAALA